MSKPDWKDAPKHAEWLSQDECGTWYWYTSRPRSLDHSWQTSSGKCMLASVTDRNHEWRETLERRP